jgi:UDP:flavonoid glycosyltransferase YjiC (YdhE family)
MKIAIITPGSRGDVQPYLALGVGLKQAGHVVRLVTHQNFEEYVNSYGIEFWPVVGDVRVIAQSKDMRALIERGNFLAILSKMAREAQRGALELAKGGLTACHDVDLIIAGIGGLFTGIAIAEKLNLPLVQAYYIPFTPTHEFPSFLFPRLPPRLSGGLNQLSFQLARQMMWQGFRSAGRLARRNLLGLPAAPFLGPFSADCLQHTPVLYGYSPSVIPIPSDWDINIHVTGYWFLDPDGAWTPPEDLMAFLQEGPPPVYVGFGSMSSRNPEQTFDLILQALARVKQRAVILSGWGGMRVTNLPETVFMVESIPFSWLFPRVAAVIHHGGAGTTAAGLRAGVPSIVIPFFGDQHFWGQRVLVLGVGPAPIPRRKLTAERLGQTIQKAVTDGQIRQRAANLGVKIRAEDGIPGAVKIIGALEVIGLPHTS